MKREPKTLFFALDCNKPDLALRLLRRGARVDDRDDQGCIALHYAAAKGYLPVVEALLSAGADVNARDNDTETVLMWAAGDGQTAVVEALLQAGADMDAVSQDTGYTALIWAAGYNHAETTRVLLAHGAEIDTADRWGQTALAKALAHRYEAVVQLLLAAGAKVVPTTGMLMAAAYGGYPEVVAAVLAQGVDVNARDETGATALKWALENGPGEVISSESSGVSIKYPHTEKRHEVVQLLREAGAQE